jgi:dihydroorotate dehydrogenase (fumarate)
VLDGAAVEARYVEILQAVQSAIAIPIAVKLSPYFSAVGNMALRLAEAGADALVLFNRFYQPDIDLGQLQLSTDLQLSDASEIRLPLLWVAVLSRRINASLAASTGVEHSEEVIKYLLAGADVVMTTSALLRFGISHMRRLLEGLTQWLHARGIETLDGFRGALSEARLQHSEGFERANYLKILQAFPTSQGHGTRR